MSQSQLYQPILSKEPEPGQQFKHIFPLSYFLKLLREEEDYFTGEEHCTRLMVTRLRKIFYDKWGWDTQLIRAAAFVKCRYQVKIVDCDMQDMVQTPEIRTVRRYRINEYKPKYRLVTYRVDDRVFGNTRVGQVPEIYRLNHQVVKLPEGYNSDIAHTIAGLDALNHPQIVSPLPFFLLFIRRLFPYADSNADVCTWLGDIATTAGDFLVTYLKKQIPLTSKEEQQFIIFNAPGSDMLGNIDAYVLHQFFPFRKKKGRRVSEMLEEYYTDNKTGNQYRSQRFRIFAERVGLKGWDGKHFSNEKEWVKYYERQLRDTAAFMVFSVTSGWPAKITVPWRLWRKKNEEVIKVKILMELFLDALKKLI